MSDFTKWLKKFLKELKKRIKRWLKRNEQRPMPVQNLKLEIDNGTSDTDMDPAHHPH